MSQENILEYLRRTPHNTNVNVVKGMIGSNDNSEDSNNYLVVYTRDSANFTIEYLNINDTIIFPELSGYNDTWSYFIENGENNDGGAYNPGDTLSISEIIEKYPHGIIFFAAISTI